MVAGNPALISTIFHSTADYSAEVVIGVFSLYCDFPSERWTRILTNNVIERLNREIRRHARVVGTFPDGNS